MARTRMIVELGMGTDLRGSDYTKAAIRAAQQQGAGSAVDGNGGHRSAEMGW